MPVPIDGMSGEPLARRLAFLLLALSVPAGVGSAFAHELGFRSSDRQLLEELQSAMDKEAIPYRRDHDGFVRYDSRYADAVERLRTELEYRLSGGVATRYDDQDSRDEIKRILAARGMEYRVETRDGREWIRWYPATHTQREEIEMMVVQRYFERQRRLHPSDCAEPAPDRESAPPGDETGQPTSPGRP